MDDLDDLKCSVDSAGNGVLDAGALAGDGSDEAARTSFHPRLVAVAANSCATDALGSYPPGHPGHGLRRALPLARRP